jgi:nitrogen fixation protein NifB
MLTSDCHPDAKTAAHPCFSADAKHTNSRLHVPVAPKCNIQCNYCNRSYDCVAESRPGVTSTILEPWQAERYAEELIASDPSMTVVGIAGPGDALANAAASLETLTLIHAAHPSVALCVATNGLALPQHADALADAGVSHVTVTVNAVDPDIGKWLYAWVRDGKNVLRGRAAAELLWERQREGIAKLVARGVVVKINTIVVPEINSGHTGEIAAACKALGATIHNCMALVPVAGAEFADVPEPSAAEMAAARAAAAVHLPQMEHCARCRADAVGRIGAPMEPSQFTILERHSAAAKPGRSLVAVASQEGMFVNRHLGEADELLIFAEGTGGEFIQVGVRQAPEPGNGSARWHDLADLLVDCRALLVSGIGPSPTEILRASGLRVYETEGLVSDLVPKAFAGGEIRKMKKPFKCGDGCGGNAKGCA